jgi:phosphate-selective porin OprO/OprP
MKLKRLFLSTGLVGALISGTAVDADETTDAIQSLKKQIEELEQKVRVLERNHELDQDAKKESAKTAPVITAGANGFNFQSADTNFAIGLHGVLQLDSRTFIDDNPKSVGNDTFLLRRARPILSGTVYRDFDFLFVPDFGGSTVQIMDAYLNYRNSPELQFQIGKMKSPVGLEHLQADVNTTFNERSIATDLVPNRDLGVELHGDIDGGVVSYAAGLFAGAPDYAGTTANSGYQDSKAFAGRFFLQPFKQTEISPLKGLGFGVGGSYEISHGTTNSASTTGLTQGFLSDGQQPFFKYSPTNGSVFASGAHWRIAPQAYYYYGPVSILGEYVINNQKVKNSNGPRAELQNTAWEITGGWVVTGENASYNGVTPKYSFDPRIGRWGALQLIARYSELHVDSAAFPTFADLATSASAAQEWAVGLNWYLNRNIRLNASYSRTTFEGGGGSKATVTRQPEQVVFTRVQLGF